MVLLGTIDLKDSLQETPARLTGCGPYAGNPHVEHPTKYDFTVSPVCCGKDLNDLLQMIALTWIEWYVTL
jgi:hypothetical protein